MKVLWKLCHLFWNDKNHFFVVFVPLKVLFSPQLGRTRASVFTALCMDCRVHRCACVYILVLCCFIRTLIMGPDAE